MGVKVFTISQLAHDTCLLLQNEFRVHIKNETLKMFPQYT